MKSTRIKYNNNVETEILHLDNEILKTEGINSELRSKCREIFHKPGIVIVDNALEPEILKNLQTSLSSKKRKFKDKFVDESKITNKVIISKRIAAEELSTLTSNLFGFNTPTSDFGIRNMVCNKEPMHYDSFYSKCGKTPLMSITNFDKKDRLWNVGYGFEELLIKRKKEITKLLENDQRNISISIKLRENSDMNLDKNLCHNISFAPNSIWFTNPKTISHQLISGGGILINTWTIDELKCKCQACLLRSNGFVKAANQSLKIKGRNKFKKFLKDLFRKEN